MVIADTPLGTEAAAPTRVHPMFRLAAALPLLAPIVVLSFGVVGTTLLLLGEYRVPLVLAGGALTALVLARLAGLGEAPLRRREQWLDVLALGAAAGFAVVNSRYTGQHLLVGRDPGVYTLAGQWLAHHHSILIPYHREVFADPLLTFDSAGFLPSGSDHLYAQGAHLLPEFLGLTSAVLGESAMFRLNVVLGGLGLLAVYGFARLLVGRGWALGVMVLLAGTLPQMAFSRDDYTEPVSQLLLFGGLALAWVAGSGRPARWAVAGLVLGGGCLARIDAFLILPTLLVYVAAVTAVAATGRSRLIAAGDGLALLGGAAVPALLGLLDLKQLSNGYYRDLHPQFSSIGHLVEAAALGGVLLVGLFWLTPARTVLMQRTRWRAPAAAALAGIVLLAGLALAVRPLFATGHAPAAPGVQAYIGSIQQRDGTAVDPTRTYAEHSVVWLAWYLGPLATALALPGVALLGWRAVRRGRMDTLPFLLILVSTAGLYLYDPSIAPDQIWAMRRYLPIVIPGAAVATAVALSWLLGRVPRRSVPVLAVLASLLLVLPVAFVSWPLARAREGVPQLTEVHRVCAAIPKGAAVVVLGDLAVGYPQTIRSYCGVPVGGLPVTVPSSRLARLAAGAEASRHRLYVVASSVTQPGVAAAPQSPAAVPVSDVVVVAWLASLSKPPRHVIAQPRSIYVGRIGLDGLVTWVRT